jgi:hypothetical protein
MEATKGDSTTLLASKLRVKKSVASLSLEGEVTVHFQVHDRLPLQEFRVSPLPSYRTVKLAMTTSFGIPHNNATISHSEISNPYICYIFSAIKRKFVSINYKSFRLRAKTNASCT